MAPKQTVDPSSAPLADWFFISGTYRSHKSSSLANEVAGVDTDQLRWRKDEDLLDAGSPIPVEPTIEEDKAAEAESEPQEASTDTLTKTPRKSKRNSYQRLSSLSDEARLSISSLSFSPEQKGTDSNRSSVTIKGIQINSTNGGLNDTDFDKALLKFASQRDSFLSDLTLSAGAVVPNRPKPRPKTQKIVNEDNGNGLKSGVGSIRRRISFRDMNSMKRQSSGKRHCGYFNLELHL